MVSLPSFFGSDTDILGESRFRLLLLANVLPPLGMSILSPVLDALTSPFGVSVANIGLIMSAFTAPAIVVIPFVGALADRFGRKPLLVYGLLLFGTGGTAIALTTDFTVVLFLRLCQGIGFALLTPVLITSIGDMYEGSAETTAQGLRFTGSGIVQTVFPLLSSGLVLLAWQFPFLLYALAFPVAFVVQAKLEEPAKELTGNASETSDVGLRDLGGLLGQRRVLAILVLRGLASGIWVGFLTYNSVIILRLLDGTSTHAGIIVAGASLSYAVASSQTGRITVSVGSWFYPLVMANVAIGLGFAILSLSTSVVVGLAGIVILGTGYGISLSLSRSLITGFAHTRRRGRLVSLGEAFGRGMATVAPILMGGTIALLTPAFGPQGALRTVGVLTAVLFSVSAVLCLVIATTAPEVRSGDSSS